MITSVAPYNGDITGLYPFILTGIFTGLTEDNVDLYWDGVQINSYVTAVTDTTIEGIVPPSESTGRVEIKLMHNLITY
jgi:hypothetical protein